MADRKQFATVTPVSDRLEALLAEARQRDVAEDVLKAQRISFAFGNAPASDRITRESVERASERVRLRG